MSRKAKDPAPVAVAASPTDMLKKLAAKGTKKAAQSTSNRQEYTLSDLEKELMERWIPAKIICDFAEERKEQAGEELKAVAFDKYTAQQWESRNKPANPELKTYKDGKPDHRAIFQVVSTFKVNMEEKENEEPQDSIVGLLTQQGIEESDAIDLVKTELDFTPQTGIRSFYELMNGKKLEGKWIPATDMEKSVANKVMEYLLSDAFTDEERAVAVTTKPKVTVKSGFLERVCSYAHSYEQLKAILRVIVPQLKLSGVKYAMSDSKLQQLERLKKDIEDIFGSVDLNDRDD